jgi:hypothetical protein
MMRCFHAWRFFESANVISKAFLELGVEILSHSTFCLRAEGGSWKYQCLSCYPVLVSLVETVQYRRRASSLAYLLA